MVYLKSMDTMNRLHEVTFPPKGVVGSINGSIDGDLYEIAATGFCQESCHFIIDEGAVAENGETHAIGHDSQDNVPEVRAAERFPSGKGYFHSVAATQFGEKLKPRFQRKVLFYIPRT